MGHVPFLDEVAIITAVSVIVTILLSRLQLPTVAGLLLAGALLGPFGIGALTSTHTIEVLAEVGVVLLLFSIGLEFSLARLKDIFQQVALGGVVQVGLTTAVIAGIASFAGFPTNQSIFYGFVFALSSTAIVLRALTDRRELDAPHGKFIVGTLIFQDLCVVPMVLIVPLLQSGGPVLEAAESIAIAIGKAALLVTGTIIIARFAVPRILSWVDASRSREVFLLAILALCIGTAWLTSLAGLSLALGAFLGGMVVADTEYSHRAMGDILPLRDAFVSLFFVSLGMLFDIRIVLHEPLLVLFLLLGFLLVKGVLATLAAMVMRFPARAAWMAGVGLAQFGEFGFVLTRLAQEHQLITKDEVTPLFAAGIASMFLTPLLLRIAPHMTAGERLLAPLERLIGVRGIDEADGITHTPTDSAEHDKHKLQNHVVIVGFGVAGRFAAQSLSSCHVPFVVLELDAANVRLGKSMGLPVYYGDATSPEALGHAHIQEARLLVLLMNDPISVERVVDCAKRIAPHVPVVTRTRYLRDRDGLKKLGAHDVVAEEVEGALEVIARMLRWVEMPRNVIEERMRVLRTGTQESARKQTIPPHQQAQQQHNTLENSSKHIRPPRFESAMVCTGSQVVGRTLAQLQLVETTGAQAVALQRGGTVSMQLDWDEPLQVGDVVHLIGNADALRSAMPIFDACGIPEQSAPT